MRRYGWHLSVGCWLVVGGGAGLVLSALVVGGGAGLVLSALVVGVDAGLLGSCVSGRGCCRVARFLR